MNLNKGNILTSLSLCLALLITGTWIAFGPLFLFDFSRITFISFVYFCLACVGTALWLLGFYNFRKIGFSWLTKILSFTRFLSSSAVLLFATIILFNVPAEVKGTVQRVGDDFMIIYVDDSYRDEYNMDGSTLASINYSSVQSLDFIVGLSKRTIVVEQNGPWMWQRKIANLSSLQEGQHIQIKYNGWRYMDGSIKEAGEIIILDE